MDGLTTIVLLVVASLASLFAAWTVGASSTGATPFAPAVGANAISTMRAAYIVGMLGFAGAVFQGAAVTETVGDRLIDGVSLSPPAATVALLIAAAYIAAGVFKGYPIATAFAVTGSVVGVGLALGGDPAWDTYLEIGLYWLLTPVFVAPVAYVSTKLLRNDDLSEPLVISVLVAVVAVVIANMEFLFLGPPGEGASIAWSIGYRLPVALGTGRVIATLGVVAVLVWLVRRDYSNDPLGAQRRFLLGLGALVAFSAGGGKVGLAVGPLLPLVGEVLVRDPMVPVLLFGAVGMLFGSWMVASRMIKALSQDYSELGPRRSIGVLVPSFVIAQVGIFFGIPMSFNEIFISAIAGTGYAVGAESVSQKKLLYTVIVWLGSLVFSLVVGFGVYRGIAFVLGLV